MKRNETQESLIKGLSRQKTDVENEIAALR